MAKIKLVGMIMDNDSAMVYSWWGFDAISAKQVQQAIDNLQDNEGLEIELNSPGGYCTVGAEIYTMLRQCSKNGHPVTVNVVGEACSAATVLMCGADVVNGSDVAMFMFHNASLSAKGKARDMRSATECLEQTDETIVNAYEYKTGKSREELHALIDAETWMSVNRAMEYGFVDGLMFEEEEEETPDDPENPDEPEEAAVNRIQSRLEEGIKRMVATSQSMIPQDKLRLMREVMMKETAHQKGISISNDVDSKNAENIENKVKGGNDKMTLEEAYEKYPELRSEVDKVRDAERKRISDIDAIAGSIPAEMVDDAKYNHPCDAKTLAYRVLAKNNQKASDYMTKAIYDSEKSHAKDVSPTPDAVKNDVTDDMASYVNEKRKKGVK